MNNDDDYKKSEQETLRVALEKQQQEIENTEKAIVELGDTIRADLQEQHASEVARQEEELTIQKEELDEAKKQTVLSEQALWRSNLGIVIGIAGLVVSLVALVFSVLPFVFG